MLYILFAAANFGLVAALILAHNPWKDWSDYFLAILIGAVGAFLGLLIAAGCQYMLAPSDFSDEEITVRSSTEIVALKDNMAGEGRHFLFSGYYEEDLKYMYLYVDGEKGMTYGSIDADKTYIKYINNDETPHIDAWRYERNSTWSKILFFSSYTSHTYYTVYIPEGSVIQTYEINLEN